MGDLSRMSMISNVYDSAIEDSDASLYFSFNVTNNKTIEAENVSANVTLEAEPVTTEVPTVIKKNGNISPLRTISKTVLQGLNGFCSTPNGSNKISDDLGVKFLDTNQNNEIVAITKENCLFVNHENENKENISDHVGNKSFTDRSEVISEGNQSENDTLKNNCSKHVDSIEANSKGLEISFAPIVPETVVTEHKFPENSDDILNENAKTRQTSEKEVSSNETDDNKLNDQEEPLCSEANHNFVLVSNVIDVKLSDDKATFPCTNDSKLSTNKPKVPDIIVTEHNSPCKSSYNFVNENAKTRQSSEKEVSSKVTDDNKLNDQEEPLCSEASYDLDVKIEHSPAKQATIGKETPAKQAIIGNETEIERKKPILIKKTLLNNIEMIPKLRINRQSLGKQSVPRKSSGKLIPKMVSWNTQLKKICQDIEQKKKLEGNDTGTSSNTNATDPPRKNHTIPKLESLTRRNVSRTSDVAKLLERKPLEPMSSVTAKRSQLRSPQTVANNITKDLRPTITGTNSRTSLNPLLLPKFRNNVEVTAVPTGKRNRKSMISDATPKPTSLKVISTKTTLNSPKCVDLRKKLQRKSVIKINSSSSTANEPIQIKTIDSKDPLQHTKRRQTLNRFSGGCIAVTKVNAQNQADIKVNPTESNKIPSFLQDQSTNSKIPCLADNSKLLVQKQSQKINQEPSKIVTNKKTLHEKVTTAKVENVCKYCDKKFSLRYALENHLLNNCNRIPSAELKKLTLTKIVPKTGIDTGTPASQRRCNSHSIEKVLRNLKIPHSGVYRTPTKMVRCHSCRINFTNVVDFSEHMLSHSPESA